LLEAGADRTRVRAVLGRVLERSRRTLCDVRRSVMDLRAAPLEGRSLVEAVEAKVVSVRTDHGLEATLDAVGAARPLPARVEMALYRMVEESLTNVVRHADATRVAVRLAVTPTDATLTVRDDGRGFEVDAPREGRYGLVGMNERAALLDGTFRVSSRPGQGTEVRVRIPLAATDGTSPGRAGSAEDVS
jgi:two-component system NarL family sensor kinase